MTDYASSTAASPVMASDARRSTRVLQAVPLIVTGQDRIGRPIVERTSAVTLNCHGCRFPSRHFYRAGSWVALEMPGPEAGGKHRRVRAQVRYIRLPGNPHELCQVGVELETPANVWGVTSPPEDWLRFPGSLSPAAAFARAAASPESQVTTQTEEEIHVVPPPSAVRTTGPPSDGTRPDSTAATAPSGAIKPARVVVPADTLLHALEGKLQQAAEKAVQSAAASYLSAAVRQAVQTITNAGGRSVRQLEENRAKQLEDLVTSAQEQLLARLKTERTQGREHWEERLEASQARAEETAARLEKILPEIHHALSDAQGFLQEAARELQDQFSARLREADERAADEFSQEAARIADRQLVRLAEKAQASVSEAAARLEARVAETRSQLETSAGTTLGEFQRRAGVETELAVAEARESVQSALASIAAAHRADCEARQHAWQEELAGSSEQAADQFRQRLESVLNSWLVAAVAAVNEQSKAVLHSLAKEGDQRLREPARGPLPR